MRDEFLDEPSAHLFGAGASVPDEWIAAAWEADDDFRRNVTVMIARNLDKGFATEPGEVGWLARALPLHRVVELYVLLRAAHPWDEPGFRPAFEQALGERAAALPPAARNRAAAGVAGIRGRVRGAGGRHPVLTRSGNPAS